VSKSLLEELLAIELNSKNCPPFLREYQFDQNGRRWRFDFAFPEFMIAVEVEGGQYVRGRHNRPAGFAADCDKLNAAVFQGWRVYRFTGEMVKSGAACATIMKALGLGG